MAVREANTELGIMPFGKYKGQSLNVVALDKRYMAFLRGQQAFYGHCYAIAYYPNTMDQLQDLLITLVPFPTRARQNPPDAKTVLNTHGRWVTNPTGGGY